jgi:PhnB protein
MNLHYDFTVNKDTKTIHLTREFAADLDLVWDAFTKAEILDQWTAPKPFRAQTKEMDFREGGRWLYAMISPEDGVRGWSLVEFIEIRPKTTFYGRNSFSDENGISLNNVFSLTRHTFLPKGETTTVHIEKKFDDLAVLEKMVSLGWKEGITAAMVNLDEYFASVVTSK